MTTDSEKQLMTQLPGLINSSHFDVQGLEGLDKKLISNVALENAADGTFLTLEHLVTQDFPFVELFHVSEIGQTPDRTRYATDMAWLYFFDHEGHVLKSLTLKGAKLIGSKLVLSTLKSDSLRIELSYSLERVY